MANGVTSRQAWTDPECFAGCSGYPSGAHAEAATAACAGTATDEHTWEEAGSSSCLAGETQMLRKEGVRNELVCF